MREDTLARIVAGTDLGRAVWFAKFRLCPGGRWFTVNTARDRPRPFGSRKDAREAARVAGMAYRLTRTQPG